MPLSPIGNSNASVPSQAPRATASASAVKSGPSVASSPNGAGDSTNSTNSSAIVTLSPAARVIAGLNAKGITVNVGSLASLGITARPTTTAGWEQLGRALAGATVSPPFNAAQHRYDGAISKSDFTGAIAQLGGTQQTAGQLFNDLDVDHSGSVSNTELFDALAATSSDPSSSTSQALLLLMDRDGNDSVSTTEYAKIETSLIAAEKQTG